MKGWRFVRWPTFILDFGRTLEAPDGPMRPQPADVDGETENAPAATDRGVSGIAGAPSKTRTCDLRVRKLLKH